MNKITLADLSEELQDMINGHTALINELAARAELSDEEVQTIKLDVSQRHLRAKEAADKAKANHKAYQEDLHEMAAWVRDVRFDFSNAKEWGKAAATEWLVICERNGSEHGRDHTYKYHEPTQDELLEALKDLERWSRATEKHNKGRREHAERTLPKVKAKLAAMLTA
jgi:DNA polymerase III delta prime subunit